jgi:hypothetical protein
MDDFPIWSDAGMAYEFERQMNEDLGDDWRHFENNCGDRSLLLGRRHNQFDLERPSSDTRTTAKKQRLVFLRIKHMENFDKKAERLAGFYKGLQANYLAESNKREGNLREFYFRLYHDAVFVTEAIETLAEVRKELLKDTPDVEKLRTLVQWDDEK